MNRSPGPDISSFTDYLGQHAPELLPGRRVERHGVAPGSPASVPHGTTIVAVAYPGGVVIAGDRRATAGNLIATRDIQKVFITDDYSAAGIAGTAGIAVEMVRLFAVELEHYEKIEGVSLTLDGKVSRMAAMVRGNLGAALQGLAAIPLLVGFDADAADPRARGRIFSFDVAGDRHEEFGGYQAIGSGSVFAKSSLKKRYRGDLTAEEALKIAVEALYDAADDDSATAGPDTVRKIYPTAVTVDAEGAAEVPDRQIAEAAGQIIEERSRSYDELRDEAGE
ncbi:20S proteasome beta-type subunit [Gordonia araii NBRC 100433]|uniref:Proteasome subunit beta n=1 Tax=Gordonia araii NBRC 100433 TaxID=1073574 RepID=G7H0K5_9ACTN|nr:proteasome subunit beta [Gordonia araii]NNG96857.1 proteasome subunit beta [Gordonia araii NBRC 100433]GAB09380.1 20S proteasome beta-type subunit [Gordonia araii NBRC 100433]